MRELLRSRYGKRFDGAMVIRMQLEESAFFNHLSQFSEIRQQHDKLYVTSAFPREADRLDYSHAHTRTTHNVTTDIGELLVALASRLVRTRSLSVQTM